MRRYIFFLLLAPAINCLLASDNNFGKLIIVRTGESVGQNSLYADERMIATVINGSIGDIAILSTMAIIEKRSDDEFRLPNPLLPLQKERD